MDTLRAVRSSYAPAEVLFKLGAYDVLEELGRGGMGTVYRAYSVKLARFVAVKVFTPRRRATETDLVRFQNEVMLAGRLRHPHIILIFDSGDDEGRPYYVMELIEGGTLGSLIAEDKQLSREPLEALVKVARALHFAHEKGVVHRDIKPDNILLHRAAGGIEPCITDFGIAKDLIDAPGLTREGRALGTPYYMPPEQANGEVAHIGPHSDVYALGATLYHVLAGRAPFHRRGHSDEEFVVLARILNEDPTPPSRVALRFGRVVPRDLETICAKAMAKEAKGRYASAEALADDLARFLRGETIAARPSSAVEKLSNRIRRNRAAWLGGVAVVLVLATLVAAFSALAIDGMKRTNASLLDKSRTEALHQAATLERAIRVNMMQGRADQARALMQLLNQSPEAGEIKVVRTDRQLAYTDPATRDRVQRWLNTPGVIDKIAKEHPDMVPAVDVLQRVAFPRIDAATTAPESVVVEKEPWNRALLTGLPQHYSEQRNGTPYLVVLWPIENKGECRVCHSDPAGDSYANDPVRAVLLVRRSQAEVVRTLKENERSTIRVGGLTAVAFVVLIVVFGRVLGFRPRRDPFAGAEIMNHLRTLVLSLWTALVVVAACRRERVVLSELPKTPLGLPEHVDPVDNPTTLAKVNLGRFLFFDPRMSSTDFMACADCHREDHGWAGRDSKSVNAMGKRTRRKAPSAANAAYATSYTWSGRSDTLENVIAIGWSQLGMTDEEAIAKKLDAVPEYRALFVSAFGAPPTGLRIRQAIAAYLRVVKLGDSAYDRFMAGDATAIDARAKRGLDTFNALGCPSCHAPPLFSDWKFHNTGAGLQDAEDQGRFEYTKVDADRKKFRTPSLRNVANTGPYFHDGSAATLEEAVTLMASGGVPNPSLDPLLKQRAPSPGEVDDLSAFLQTLSSKPTFEAPKTLPGGRPRT